MRKVLPLVLSLLVFAALLALVDRDDVTFAVTKLKKTDCPESVRKDIINTLQSYNKILADFYASGGVPGMLNAMPASKQMRHEIFRDIGYVKQVNKFLVYDMATNTPFTITLTGPGRAEARMYEEWNYMYQNSDRSPNTRPMGFGRGVRYFLVKKDGKWQVDDWDPDPQVPDMSSKEFKF